MFQVQQATPDQTEDSGILTFQDRLERYCWKNHLLSPQLETSPSFEWRYFPAIEYEGEVLEHHWLCWYSWREKREVWDQILTDIIYEETDNLRDVPRLRCEVYGILEPLKVRTITKGESIPYYAAKKFQKELWKALQGFPCFRLTGRPVSTTDLLDILKRPIMVEGMTGMMEWFSVDYSAATDCLSAGLSSLILEYLIEPLQVPRQFKDLLLKVLAPHEVFYPPLKVGEEMITVETVLQKNGQLMGSPISFPILCLANVGLGLWVTEDSPIPFWDRLDSFLVNGDDMLYRAPPTLWGRHVEYGRRIGLEMSVGKAYHHRDYANINSTCFHSVGDNFVTEIPYLNTGLLVGQNKVIQKDVHVEENGQQDLISIINPLLLGAVTQRRQVWVLQEFLKLHQEPISKMAGWRNLFLDQSLGGLGVKKPVYWRSKVTQVQRLFAQERIAEGGEFSQLSAIGPWWPEVPKYSREEPPWALSVDQEKDFRVPRFGPLRKHRKKGWFRGNLFNLRLRLVTEPASWELSFPPVAKGYSEEFWWDTIHQEALWRMSLSHDLAHYSQLKPYTNEVFVRLPQVGVLL